MYWIHYHLKLVEVNDQVLIMQALLWSPQFLILDEPVSSLDPYIQDEIIQILSDLGMIWI